MSIRIRSSRLLTTFILAGAVASATALFGDPPVLPQVAPPNVPCQPLVCLQMTDVVEVAPNTWRIEFESLNWTAFTDRPCPPGAPGCIDRTSPGTAAEGLVFVRSASLSTVKFRVLPVDPNGAPLGTEDVLGESGTTFRLASGELALQLGQGFVARIVDLVDTIAGTSLSPACYELRDDLTGLVVFSETGTCLVETMGLSDVSVDYEVYAGAMATTANTWSSSLCTADQIIWTQDPEVLPPLVIPPGDSNVTPSCPVTCEEKDSLGNVLDGFVVEIEDFMPGDRLVFNWYFLGSSGPIASGAPPTPTDPGTLAPSPDDPWGFSFGSYQIDRKPTCLGGICDTILVTMPPVTDPALNCLVDEDLNRDDLPFDIYVSLGPAGTDPPCGIEPVVSRDSKGIERLMVRATSGTDTDQITVQFRNLDTNVIEKTERLSLQAASAEIETSDLVGRYEVGGTCENTVTRRFFFLDKFTMAIPRRGDLADVTSVSEAFEMDEATGGIALTAQMPPGALQLNDVVEACHFVQLTDSAGNVRIIGTSNGPETLSRSGALLVRDTAPPSVACDPPITVGTSLDGGLDCEVGVSTTGVATDAAGGFTLTNDLDPGASTRSFGAAVGGPEMAVQTPSGVFLGRTTSTVTFDVTDDAGQAASCATTITVVDDTAPVVNCALLPDAPPPGTGGGGNGPPSTPPGQGGNPPGQGSSDRFVIVDFAGNDNCDAGGIMLSAEIDGVTVTNGQSVQITLISSGPVTTDTKNGRLQIKTPLTGVLTVTATDQDGNQSVCQTPPL